MYKDNQNGRSMVEMMGYLMVVMGVIIAMGRIVSSAFDNHKYSTASLQLTELVNAMVKASAIDYDYSEVVNKIKTADGAKELAPNTYRVVGTDIYHAFGGKVTVATADENTKLVITYEKLSKKQCVELAMKDWRKNQYADLFSIRVNGDDWYWVAYGDGTNSDTTLQKLKDGDCSDGKNKGPCALPMRRSALTGVGDNDGQCTDSRNNTITWTFN
jgi:hypothetical protein